jgi:hypothetical protein
MTFITKNTSDDATKTIMDSVALKYFTFTLERFNILQSATYTLGMELLKTWKIYYPTVKNRKALTLPPREKTVHFLP